MHERTMPTLLVQGGNYANLREIRLEDVSPVQFPFGLGGPKMQRQNKVSPEECYRHYCCLSLKQFMRCDFLLLLNHMNCRILSYRSASIKCRSQISGVSLAERVSLLGVTELQQAARMRECGEHVPGRAGEFLKAVSTNK